MATKICSGCAEEKDHSDFYTSNYYKLKRVDGLDYYCKECRTTSNLQSQRSDKLNKPCSFEFCDSPHYAKSYCRKHYARLVRNGKVERLYGSVDVISLLKTQQLQELTKKKWYLKNQYNITLEEYIEKASKGCEICGRQEAENLHVDHDHKCCDSPKSCGYCVRGLVCNRCNTAIDKFENNLLRVDYPNYAGVKEYIHKYA